MTSDLIPVATLDDFPASGLKVVEQGGREILLCRTGDAVYAVDNLCSHAAEKLCNGKLKGGKIFCPLHGAAFDVKTGEALSRPASVPIDTFEVAIEAGQVFLRLGG
ncbi:MAG: Rieske (2Fe-2S) protein [Halioglobus sp.]